MTLCVHLSSLSLELMVLNVFSPVHPSNATDNTDNQILSRILSLNAQIRLLFLFFRKKGIGIVLFGVGYIQFENKNKAQTFFVQWLTKFPAIHICISEMERIDFLIFIHTWILWNGKLQRR